LAYFNTGNNVSVRQQSTVKKTVSVVKNSPVKKAMLSPQAMPKEIFVSGNDDWEEF